jgi:hypothetical protein
MPKLFESLLGQPLNSLNAEGLCDLIRRSHGESSNLEIKEYSSNWKPGILKNVSAFLNSDGGVIIGGLSDAYTLAAFPPNINNQQIHNVINDTISPKPIGIDINSLPCEGGNVWIIEVPKSVYKPHMFQGSDEKRYYFRSGTSTLVADHWMVKLMFESKIKAILDGCFDVISVSSTSGNFISARINFIIKNLSYAVVAREITLALFTQSGADVSNILNSARFVIWNEQTTAQLTLDRPVHKGLGSSNSFNLTINIDEIALGEPVLTAKFGSVDSVLYETNLSLVINEDGPHLVPSDCKECE